MVAEAGLKIFVIAVVGGGGELELLSSTRGVGRFREDDNVADEPVRVVACSRDGARG